MDPTNTDMPFDPEAERYWGPVDLYIGGVEHAVLHLLYARFWHKVLYDCGLVHTKEPFQRLFNQGMILAFSYRDSDGKYYNPKDVEERDDGWYVKGTDKPLQTRSEKMSKYDAIKATRQTLGEDAFQAYNFRPKTSAAA